MPFLPPNQQRQSTVSKHMHKMKIIQLMHRKIHQGLKKTKDRPSKNTAPLITKIAKSEIWSATGSWWKTCPIFPYNLFSSSNRCTAVTTTNYHLTVVQYREAVNSIQMTIYTAYWPVSGTSVGLIIRRICSIDCKSGDKPAHHSNTLRSNIKE